MRFLFEFDEKSLLKDRNGEEIHEITILLVSAV